MKRTGLPQARLDTLKFSADAQWDVVPQARERWSSNIIAAAAEKEDKPVISMLDPIGGSIFSEGVTDKRIAAALRSIGPDKDVVVHLNSPGGNFFMGMAIYNMLREHRGEVTVKILGIAASIASVIAMAGDRVEIARGGFIMIHNSMIAAFGNRNDFMEIADGLEVFDMAMADIYAAHTGLDLKAVTKKMDAETFINGSAAVDEGWADALLPADAIKEDKKVSARAPGHLLDTALAQSGMTRSARRALIQDFKASMLGAAGVKDDTPRAVENEGTLRAAEKTYELLKDFTITI